MPDWFAPLALEFIALHGNRAYKGEGDFHQHIYRFLIERDVKIAVTKKTITRLAWSIGMNTPRRDT